jgi:hypothetical protein
VGAFPDDSIVRRNAALIRMVESELTGAGLNQAALVLASLAEILQADLRHA